MTKEEISDAVSYIKSYRRLDENLHNTTPKGSVSFYATEKCLHYWDMAIKALELVEYIEQRYEEECNERREHYADGRYHSLSMSDGASYVLGQVLDKWKESVEDKK